MQKLSTFFTLENGLTNKLGIKQEVPDNKVYLYNMNYSASRLDLIKFSLNMEFNIINWFLEEEVANEMKIHPSSALRKGLAVEFRVDGSNTRNIFELIKNKILGKNTVTFSAAELIYNEVTDSIFISFKTNMMMEQCKIGLLEKGKTFRWLYIANEKVVTTSGKNGGSKGQGYKQSSHKDSGYKTGKSKFTKGRR